MKISSLLLSCICTGALISPLNADESLLGITKSAEPLPSGAIDFVQHINIDSNKGSGSYQGIYTKTELEYGVTDKFTIAGYILGQSVNSKGIVINAYIPDDHAAGWEASGFELEGKYNYLSTAGDDFGLSQSFSYTHLFKDPHSGLNKNVDTFELKLLAQKYFLDGQLIWLGNLGIETTRAKRAPLSAGQWSNLNAKGYYETEAEASGNNGTVYEWPVIPEMEIGLMGSTGVSYRFMDNWFLGAEYIYEQENETEVGIERFSHFVGGSLHYGAQQWWTTISYLRQISGGGDVYPEQDDMNLHLIERTKNKLMFKVGFNF